jgi:DNA-binding Lrp family transcriptional regulator
MIQAFLHVSCEPGSIAKMGPVLADLNGVAELYTTTGSLDFIAVVQVADVGVLADLITEGIATVPGIRHTETHVAIRSYGREDNAVAFDIGLD